MKYFEILLSWILFPPLYFFISKKYGVRAVYRWLFMFVSPLGFIIALFVAVCVSIFNDFTGNGSNYGYPYPDEADVSYATGLDFPKLNAIDSSAFSMPAFVVTTTTFVPEQGKLSNDIYEQLEHKCATESTWTKESDAYVYDDGFGWRSVRIDLPNVGNRITVKETHDTGN